MDVEEKIREQRTNEAIQKNYMGQQGKIYLIAKFLGTPITKQTDSVGMLPWDYLPEENDEIQILGEDSNSYDIGHFFDGLNRGLNLEIICHDYDGTIKLKWEGYTYYEEENNTLVRYYPYPPLEKIVDSLYTVVEDRIKQQYEKLRKEEIRQAPALERAEIERLRDKWGNII